LWDTRTGRLITQYKDGGVPGLVNYRFSGDGHWIMAIESGSNVLVFSADDGRHVGRLEHPATEMVDCVDASPSGNRIATASHCPDGKHLVRLWDANSWKAKSGATPVESSREVSFWTEDTFTAKGNSGLRYVQRFGDPKPIGLFSDIQRPLLIGDQVEIEGKEVYDFRTWHRLRPPQGRRFHPDLVRFAPDGRFTFVGYFPFVGPQDCLFIDTRTEKEFHLVSGWEFDTPPRNFPGLGLVWAAKANEETLEIRLLPSTNRLAIRPEMLELWAQVTVRGELGEDGRLVKWDEPTWEKKRQELAAIPAPQPDFPFPGYVATDKLHWLRAEYFAAANDGDKQRLAKELLRKAEANGDKAEAIRWRAILTPAVDKEAKPVAK